MQIEDNQEIRREVRDHLVSSFYLPDELADSASLTKHGVIDSVSELVAFLESNFSVGIEEDEIVAENLGSIARIASFVCRKKAASAQPVEEAIDDAVDELGMGDGSHMADALEFDHVDAR